MNVSSKTRFTESKGTQGFSLLKMDGNDNKNAVKNKNTTTRFSLE